MMDTKNQILTVSLDLFSQKGYDGVSIREIAKIVGVRESAIYKHFTNKQEILNKIAEKMSQEIHEAYEKLEVPGVTATTSPTAPADFSAQYKKLSGKKVCDLVWNIFQLFTGDTELAKFRRLLMREQFNNKTFSECYNNFFLNGVLQAQSKTFLQLVKGGLFKKEDEKIIALHFYGPVLFLFQQFDCNPEEAGQIKEMLAAHVIAFGKLYSK